MDARTIIEEITSRDSHKVWRSACEIISLGQEPTLIKPLIEFIPLIRQKTIGLEMGGAFALNQRFIDFAIRTLEFHKNNMGCPCALFGGHDSMEPNKEEERGYITITDKVLLEGNYVDYYLATCKRCHQKFKIIERDYHYTWWGWERIDKT
ncbi:hypothetical protein [Chryseosolibacter indicus]|uniref:Uncharacterized protein n=1 Tax=Chryseosolibacter indicus TaxID=2782351 RepID=A0ABS5VUN3_9BACT|nr:hypothetical protein [Chryseosolibacter indicus]MBT1705137.1 hypothetical protein [Chryseosolibacter indicus]